MHPVDVLSQEHRQIETMLDAVESRIHDSRPEDPFPFAFLTEALEFFRDFADGAHHAKEEKLLFPRMKLRGVPQEGGPIGVMMAEHDEGRGYLSTVRQNLEPAAAGSAGARRAVEENAMAYVNLLRHHIYKEDNVLFRMGKMVLSAADVSELQREFDAVNSTPAYAAMVHAAKV
jgi:hemerythrin-like domain-containing protein